MNKELEKRIFSLGKSETSTDSVWTATRNLYMENFIHVENGIPLSDEIIKKGYFYIVTKYYSCVGYTIQSSEMYNKAYDKNGNRKYECFCPKNGCFKNITDFDIPSEEFEVFRSVSEAEQSTGWKLALADEEKRRNEKIFTSVTYYRKDKEEEHLPFIYIGSNDPDISDYSISYSICKVIIDNRYPIYYGQNRKGTFKASLDYDDLAKFDKVFTGFVNQVNNNRVYMIEVDYGFDYNYSANGGGSIFESTGHSSVFHSVTEAKKSEFWQNHLKKAKDHKYGYVEDKFSITLKDEFGDKFIQDDVMCGLFSMTIVPVTVIHRDNEEKK